LKSYTAQLDTEEVVQYLADRGKTAPGPDIVRVTRRRFFTAR
jgi:hypothetical protein